MSNLPAFGTYAGAFEESLIDDNWERLEQYFSPDATYRPGDGTEAVGRAGVIAAMKDSVDSLERKCDARELLGEPGISESGDTITLKFSIKYTKTGSPDYILDGIETIQYAGGLISKMEDVFEDPDGLSAWRDGL